MPRIVAKNPDPNVILEPVDPRWMTLAYEETWEFQEHLTAANGVIEDLYKVAPVYVENSCDPENVASYGIIPILNLTAYFGMSDAVAIEALTRALHLMRYITATTGNRIDTDPACIPPYALAVAAVHPCLFLEGFDRHRFADQLAKASVLYLMPSGHMVGHDIELQEEWVQ